MLLAAQLLVFLLRCEVSLDLLVAFLHGPQHLLLLLHGQLLLGHTVDAYDLSLDFTHNDALQLLHLKLNLTILECLLIALELESLLEHLLFV